MKKFLAIVVLGLLWCNVGFADVVKLKCTTIETKRIYGKTEGDWEKTPNQKAAIYSHTKTIKDNKIESWWLKEKGTPGLYAVDWIKQDASTLDKKLTTNDKLILKLHNQLEKKYKQPGDIMFFDHIEGVGYEHAYLNSKNSELLRITVVTDLEFLKSMNVVEKEATFFRKISCEVLK